MHWISAPLAPDHSYHFSKVQCRLKASPYESPGEQPESEHSKLALQTVLPNKDIDIAEEVTSYTTSLCQARGNEVDPCCDVVAPWQQTHLQASMSTSLFQSTRSEHFQTMPCYTTITIHHHCNRYDLDVLDACNSRSEAVSCSQNPAVSQQCPDMAYGCMWCRPSV